ncbi:lipid IV(A) 3-deoxy-D-manno-octulosonic acid transferase [Uliginosibacterium sp. 31-16]|uniref:lipid IV(A) 3-deoxy-D-manno-octulosonic acid transferase n=1 Tax=Uliginosibacterium sp. 31-16 TaxID=3068315 RepID=UPI00273ECBDD|nr:lipid IV(A) 3-deoxy-D-manno-octulosonic acid transferase [Uliginosibacterium sp. 31-16]MDP5238388.1 lipid IV(A) 3-deoxy-D-manno-octulosonic acid transferase [Uliginosibacterium sp. 31-16]
MNRLLYSVLWHLGLPLIGLRLLYRARKQPEYLQHLAERFGAAPLAGTDANARPRIWLHAVSVGETRAAQPLVKALLAAYPQHEILLTHMTPTGRATSEELFGKEPRVTRCYLPYDFPWAQRRFLARAKPLLGVVMETEVWPNLMAATERLKIPMLLVNARLSARSARGYQKLGRLARDTFGRFAKVLAQTQDDAERLVACGAKTIEVSGNVKFDVELAPALLALGEQFKAAANGRPIILAASTREGEEEPLLAAFSRHAPAEALLVLVPRHPQRFDAVAAMVSAQGLASTRRSAGLQPISADTRVWLGDSMGEMVAYYRMADVAIIGGSWQPLGGQNLIEACAAGTPVLVGPHTFNFTEAAAKAIEAGAALRCTDLDAALASCVQLLDDAAARQTMGRTGKHFADSNRGATARTVQAISQALPA